MRRSVIIALVLLATIAFTPTLLAQSPGSPSAPDFSNDLLSICGPCTDPFNSMQMYSTSVGVISINLRPGIELAVVTFDPPSGSSSRTTGTVLYDSGWTSTTLDLSSKPTTFSVGDQLVLTVLVTTQQAIVSDSQSGQVEVFCGPQAAKQSPPPQATYQIASCEQIEPVPDVLLTPGS